MDWQVFETFCQRKTSELTYLDDFFAICSVVLKDRPRKAGGDFEPDTVSSFQNTLALHW